MVCFCTFFFRALQWETVAFFCAFPAAAGKLRGFSRFLRLQGASCGAFAHCEWRRGKLGPRFTHIGDFSLQVSSKVACLELCRLLVPNGAWHRRTELVQEHCSVGVGSERTRRCLLDRFEVKAGKLPALLFDLFAFAVGPALQGGGKL